MPTLSKKSESLTARAYRHIRTKILSGEFSAGEPLSEENLSAEIGISRTPVREAMGQLVAEGILDRTVGRGTSVRCPSRADVIELFELREALECYAVAKVAQRSLPPEEASHLDRLCRQVLALTKQLEREGGGSLGKEQMDRFLSMDLEYHSWLLRAGGNWRILKAVHDARLLIRIFTLPHEGHTLEELRRIYEDHAGILAAIRSGDRARAVQLCESHIQRSRQERIEKYDRQERMSQIRIEHAMFAGLIAMEGGEEAASHKAGIPNQRRDADAASSRRRSRPRRPV